MKFCYPIAIDSDDSFLTLCEKWDRWVDRRMQFAGGWTSEMSRACHARALGALMFSPEESAELEAMARQLGRLYQRLGHGIYQELSGLTGDARSRRAAPWLEGYSPAEQQVLLDVIDSPAAADRLNWATTLRADFLWTASGPKIVEVNSDNVGGLEDLMLHLSFYAASADADPLLLPAIRTSLERVRGSSVAWLKFHWNRFVSSRSGRPTTPSIAFLSADWDCSLFLSKYLHAALLEEPDFADWKTVACRPELLHADQGNPAVEDLWGHRQSAHVLMRNWLFHEMFQARGVLNPDFKTMIEVTRANSALILNPIFDRWLFSKDWLRRLLNAEDLPIILTDDESSFVQRYFVPTKRAVEADLLRTDVVLKPIKEFGGKQVYRVDPEGRQSGTAPGAADLEASAWVCQPNVAGAKHDAWLRTQVLSGEQRVAHRANMHSILGLLVHGMDEPRLAGIQVRMGTDPVVNWSRGAQVLPGILTTASESR